MIESLKREIAAQKEVVSQLKQVAEKESKPPVLFLNWYSFLDSYEWVCRNGSFSNNGKRLHFGSFLFSILIIERKSQAFKSTCFGWTTTCCSISAYTESERRNRKINKGNECIAFASVLRTILSGGSFCFWNNTRRNKLRNYRVFIEQYSKTTKSNPLISPHAKNENNHFPFSLLKQRILAGLRRRIFETKKARIVVLFWILYL